MPPKTNLAHFLSASVIVLGLTPLVVVVGAQARIAFVLIGIGTRKST